MPGGTPAAWPAREADLPGHRRQGRRTARPAATGSAKTAPATSSRWSTTASSTATCSSSARPTTCCKRRARPVRRRAARRLRRVEQGRARQLPDRDHRATSSPTRTTDGAAARRQDPRHRRPEGHRQVDRRSARSTSACPLTLIGEAVFARCLSAHQGRARRRRPRSCTGPTPKFDRRPQARSSRTSRRRSTLARSSPTRRATCCMRGRRQGARLEPELRRHRAHVARRLHHPRGLPRQDQGGLRQATRSSPTCCSTPFFRDRRRRAPGGLAQGRSPRPSSSASRCRPSPRRSPSSTATARERLPANLLQAQRDYFGAHTYERVDKPRGQFFHTNWTGRGGDDLVLHLQRLGRYPCP